MARGARRVVTVQRDSRSRRAKKQTKCDDSVMNLRAALTLIPAALLITACGSSTSDTPEYTVTSDTDNTINVTVATSDSLEGVVDAVAENYSDSPDGGYDVMIFCESNDEKLAWGRFAIGNLGAAQTGMDEGATELRQTYDVDCA